MSNDVTESALAKILAESVKPEQTTWADEDTIVFTRQEVRALQVYIDQHQFTELQEQYERGHRANVTRIEQLVKDAESKAPELWNAGFIAGLKRALQVLEGRG